MKNELAKIKSLIFEVRGQQVMLDEDLARIYQVETRILNQAVKRNIDRFPPEFMFQLTDNEFKNLISQFVTSSGKHGGRRKLPFVFTEHGVVMLSSILNSKIATRINIAVVNAFIEMRYYLRTKTDTSNQITELRKLLMLHIENTEYKFSKHEKAIMQIFQVLDNLIEQPKPTKRIGFNAD